MAPPSQCRRDFPRITRLSRGSGRQIELVRDRGCAQEVPFHDGPGLGELSLPKELAGSLERQHEPTTEVIGSSIAGAGLEPATPAL
jgi:hypothetical protein